jgi:hypothetical protein
MMWRMRQVAGLFAVLALHAAGLVSAAPPARAADPPPAGQITYAVHFTLAPRWLDPGDNEGMITPYYDRAIYAPIWENGFIRGVGPRVDEPAFALIPYFPYSAPYEELRLKP